MHQTHFTIDVMIENDISQPILRSFVKRTYYGTSAFSLKPLFQSPFYWALKMVTFGPNKLDITINYTFLYQPITIFGCWQTYKNNIMKYIYVILLGSCKSDKTITESQIKDFEQLAQSYQSKYTVGGNNCEEILSAMDENKKMWSRRDF